MTAVLLLGPATPLVFMGQEFSASTPFAFFADYRGDMATQVWDGRRRETFGFEPYADPAAQARLLDPCARETVVRSTLDFAECARNEPTLRLFRDLMWLRRRDPVLNARPLVRFDGATLTEHAFVLRWYATEGSDRLLIVNLGAQIDKAGIPEPLLAAPAGTAWHMTWSSNDPAYGGLGTRFPFRKTAGSSTPNAASCASPSPSNPSTHRRVIMIEELHDVSEVRSLLAARLKQFESGDLVVTRRSTGHEDCTGAVITELKRVLVLIGDDSKWPTTSKGRHENEQTALAGPSYLKKPE